MKIKNDTKEKLKIFTKAYRADCTGLPARNIPDAVEYLLEFWIANSNDLYIKKFPKVSFNYND